mgnify:CR=1 FL=1
MGQGQTIAVNGTVADTSVRADLVDAVAANGIAGGGAGVADDDLFRVDLGELEAVEPEGLGLFAQDLQGQVGPLAGAKCYRSTHDFRSFSKLMILGADCFQKGVLVSRPNDRLFLCRDV